MWLIEKTTCPMCRRNIELQKVVLDAKHWGLSVGILIEIEVTVYPMYKLELFESMYFECFARIKPNTTLLKSTLDFYIDYIKNDHECCRILELLKSLSYNSPILIKKAQYTTKERLHFFV